MYIIVFNRIILRLKITYTIVLYRTILTRGRTVQQAVSLISAAKIVSLFFWVCIWNSGKELFFGLLKGLPSSKKKQKKLLAVIIVSMYRASSGGIWKQIKEAHLKFKIIIITTHFHIPIYGCHMDYNLDMAYNI